MAKEAFIKDRIIFIRFSCDISSLALTYSHFHENKLA